MSKQPMRDVEPGRLAEEQVAEHLTAHPGRDRGQYAERLRRPRHLHWWRCGSPSLIER
jgi:hypothetical protein